MKKMRIISILILAVMFCSACFAPAPPLTPEVIVVTATPEPTVITPTATALPPTEVPTEVPTETPAPKDTCLSVNDLGVYIHNLYNYNPEFGWISEISAYGAWISTPTFPVLVGYTLNNGCIDSLSVIVGLDKNSDMFNAGEFLAMPAVLLVHSGYDNDADAFEAFAIYHIENASMGKQTGGGKHAEWSITINVGENTGKLMVGTIVYFDTASRSEKPASEGLNSLSG